MEQMEKIQGTEREFIKVFQELCYSRSSWQVWADLMAAMACTLANSVDKTEPRYTAREKEYEECIKRLGGVEKPAKCFAIVVEALERNPNQDFLGKLYMSLELGNHWKGQFFTPYHVSLACAELVVPKNINDDRIPLHEPSCGSGGMVVATAQVLQKRGINYQKTLDVVCQDLDWLAVYMCYVQLSLLGIKAIVVQGDTLAEPYKKGYPKERVFYTPAKRGLLI